MLVRPPACAKLEAAASDGKELDAVDLLLVERPSSVAEEAEDGILLAPPLPGEPEYEFISLSLVAGEPTELVDVLGLIALLLLLKACEVAKLDDTTKLKDEILSLKALEVTEFDDAFGLKKVVSSLEVSDEIELDDSLEVKDLEFSFEALDMTDVEVLEVLELKDTVLLLKACEVAELDDSNTVLDVSGTAAAAEPVTDFMLDSKGIDELLSSVL